MTSQHIVAGAVPAVPGRLLEVRPPEPNDSGSQTGSQPGANIGRHQATPDG